MTTHRGGRPRKYHFGVLKIGEHFDVALRSMGHRTSVASAAWTYGKAHGMKFSTTIGFLDPESGWRDVDRRTTSSHVRVTRIA